MTGMPNGIDPIVQEGTRRVVGREVLRRASRIILRWQQEERDKETLAREIIVGLTIFFVTIAIAIVIRILY